MRLRPERLAVGDTVGIIAPASPPNRENLQRALAFLEELGLKYKMGKHVDKVNGHLAGTDAQRAEDFHAMFEDDSIKGIICAGGGYGTARFAQSIDYQLVKEHPKIFWGYSDITYLHSALGKYSDIVTFHGPMLASDVGKDSFQDLSKKMFQQLFMPMELHYTEAISPLTTLSEGSARGELVGGNLSLITSAIGTKYELDMKGKLLLIEDVGEAPYRIDGMLNQLKLAGKLDEVQGVVVGDFSKVDREKKDNSQTIDEVFDHYLGNLNKPVVKGFKIGHCQPHFAVPLGVEAKLDATAKTLTVLPGVQ
ncbi:LD-carboxypeptidase [Sporosarcina sp. FSL K6-1522]|uniref:S66 peptidase family protein n=1 Tax=Sporosarcina sp. FSL K6-1522 TaxID=2921554 RepID=UPI00315AEA30